MSRYSYFSNGLLVGTLWCMGVLGFVQDVMGPEAWTRFELEHWDPSWRSIFFNCAALATSLTLWWRVRQRADLEDREKKE